MKLAARQRDSVNLLDFNNNRQWRARCCLALAWGGAAVSGTFGKRAHTRAGTR